MQLPQRTKKTSQQNPFAHHQPSVKVSDDVSWRDKISLHQFDNYLSQVKINLTTVNSSCHTQDIWRVHLSAGQCSDTSGHNVISFLARNLAKCWLILKFFYSTSRLSSEFAVNFHCKCHNISKPSCSALWFIVNHSSCFKLGFIAISLLQIYCRGYQWKNFQNQLTFDKVICISWLSHFLCSTVYTHFWGSCP